MSQLRQEWQAIAGTNFTKQLDIVSCFNIELPSVRHPFGQVPHFIIFDHFSTAVAHQGLVFMDGPTDARVHFLCFMPSYVKGNAQGFPPSVLQLSGRD